MSSRPIPVRRALAAAARLAPATRTLGWLTTWLMTAAMGALALSQAIGITGSPTVYVVHSLTPYLLAPAAPLAALAALGRHHVLALTNAMILLALMVLTGPVVFDGGAPLAPPDAATVRVAHANAYYMNDTPRAAAATLLGLGVDVIAVTEYDDELADAFDALGVDDRYAFRIDQSSPSPGGVALFSRYPIVEGSVVLIGRQYGIEAIVDVNGSLLRVMVVHPFPGADETALADLNNDLRVFAARAASPGPPTMLVGDFNASRWHPQFRELLGTGLADAHEALGKGFSRSWPTGAGLPRFVRLDHALLDDRVIPVQVNDIVVPGSDHLGFVVEVAILNR